MPGAVAGGGGDWKDVSENPLKRARSPDDEGEGGRGVGFFQSPPSITSLTVQMQEPRAKVDEPDHDAGRM